MSSEKVTNFESLSSSQIEASETSCLCINAFTCEYSRSLSEVRIPWHDTIKGEGKKKVYPFKLNVLEPSLHALSRKSISLVYKPPSLQFDINQSYDGSISPGTAVLLHKTAQ